MPLLSIRAITAIAMIAAVAHSTALASWRESI
jgi:hypothetical protein